MSSAHSFAGFNPRPSPWGYNWTAEDVTAHARESPTTPQANHCAAPSSPEPFDQQLANMPAALLSTLKREKKPFTYTPGGVNLSEVLNARLQKRLQRKKRYSEEKAREEEEQQNRFDAAPPRQVVVMPTYNSPLDMYSMQNALEMLEVQAELVAGDQSLSSPRSATLPRSHTFRCDERDFDPGRGVAQSKAFRVLQIMTDTEEEATERSRPQHRDEMRFTGIRESKSIPSKFFQTLQKITGTDQDDDDDEHVQQHEQQRTVGVVRQPEKPSDPVSKPAYMPKQVQPNGSPSFHLQQQQTPASTTLKRPAAFLPIKTGPGLGFRSVQPPSTLPNGPHRGFGNPVAGTDF